MVFPWDLEAVNWSIADRSAQRFILGDVVRVEGVWGIRREPRQFFLLLACLPRC